MSAAWNAKVLGEDVKVQRVNHKVISVPDIISTDLLSELPAAVEFVEKAVSTGGSVLVHCMAGGSRSATVRKRILACVMKR